MYSSVMSSFHLREKEGLQEDFLGDVSGDEMQGLQSTAGAEA